MARRILSFRGAMPRAMMLDMLLWLLLFKIAAAHEHHSDDIPEGEAISAAPIVIHPSRMKRGKTSDETARMLRYGSIS